MKVTLFAHGELNAFFDEVYKNQPASDTLKIQKSASSRHRQNTKISQYARISSKVTWVPEALNNLERPPVPAGRLSNKSNLPVLEIARECRIRFRELLVGIAE